MWWRILRPILALLFIGVAVWQVQLLEAQFTEKTHILELDTIAAVEGPFEVGITREGVISGTSAIPIKIPERFYWRQPTVKWVITDGVKVKKDQVVAKFDVSQQHYELDNARMEYNSALQQVKQAEREAVRSVEEAEQEIERQTNAVKMAGQSTSVDMEQAQTQVELDTWNLTRAQKDYDRQLRLRKAGLISREAVEGAERNLRSQEHGLTAAKKDLEQKKAENQIKAAQAQTDIETAKFNLEMAKRRAKESVKSAEENVKRSKEQLDRYEKDIGSGDVLSPADGTVVLGMAWDMSGMHIIRAGDQVWGGLGNITDPNKLEIAVRVSEATISKIHMKQEVVVTAEGVPGRKFKGEVISVGTVAHTVNVYEDPNASPDERVFDITVKLLDADPKVLRTGMKAKTKFVFNRLSKVVSVPLSAVIHRPGKGEFVYVQHGQGYTERKVETGERNDEAIVIVRNLRKGERVTLDDPTKIETE